MDVPIVHRWGSPWHRVYRVPSRHDAVVRCVTLVVVAARKKWTGCGPWWDVVGRRRIGVLVLLLRTVGHSSGRPCRRPALFLLLPARLSRAKQTEPWRIERGRMGICPIRFAVVEMMVSVGNRPAGVTTPRRLHIHKRLPRKPASDGEKRKF